MLESISTHSNPLDSLLLHNYRFGNFSQTKMKSTFETIMKQLRTLSLENCGLSEQELISILDLTTNTESITIKQLSLSGNVNLNKKSVLPYLLGLLSSSASSLEELYIDESGLDDFAGERIFAQLLDCGSRLRNLSMANLELAKKSEIALSKLFAQAKENLFLEKLNLNGNPFSMFHLCANAKTSINKIKALELNEMTPILSNFADFLRLFPFLQEISVGLIDNPNIIIFHRIVAEHFPNLRKFHFQNIQSISVKLRYLSAQFDSKQRRADLASILTKQEQAMFGSRQIFDVNDISSKEFPDLINQKTANEIQTNETIKEKENLPSCICRKEDNSEMIACDCCDEYANHYIYF